MELGRHLPVASRSDHEPAGFLTIIIYNGPLGVVPSVAPEDQLFCISVMKPSEPHLAEPTSAEIRTKWMHTSTSPDIIQEND